MALSRGDNGDATIVYIGTREKREVWRSCLSCPLLFCNISMQPH